MGRSRGHFGVRVWTATAVVAALGTTGLTGTGVSSAASRPLRVPAATAPRAPAVRGAQLWVQRLATASATTPDSVAVSPGGSTVFVTGQTTGATSADTTVAYNASTGARKWTKRSTSFSDGDTAAAVAVSPTGKQVFVTGTSSHFSGGNVSFDYVTVAYNAATGAQQWVRHYNGPAKPSDNSPVAVAVSPSGKTVFVTGTSHGKTSGPDYATVAYSAATGAQQWVKRFTSPGTGVQSADAPSSLAVSPTGNSVYVTGASGSSVSPYTTVAYNAVTGAQRWVKQYSRPPAGSAATSVAVSRTGGMVFVTGDSGGNYATVAYNASTGQQAWAKRYLGIAGTSGAT